MLSKLAIVLIFIQIVVSLVYSSYSLKLNRQFTDNLHRLDELKQSIEAKESQLATQESLTNLKNSTNSATLVPLIKKLNEYN